MSQPLCLDSVPDDELLERLSTLVDRHRRCEAELVAHIAEVDARELYLGRACSSMWLRVRTRLPACASCRRPGAARASDSAQNESQGPPRSEPLGLRPPRRQRPWTRPRPPRCSPTLRQRRLNQPVRRRWRRRRRAPRHGVRATCPPDVIELRCRAHNVQQAVLDFGSETMARYRTGTSRAREPQAAYGPVAAGIELRAAPREVASGGVAEARAPKGSPATEPVVEAPRVADPRGAAGALPGYTRPPTRTTPGGGRNAGSATRSFWPGAPLLVARPCGEWGTVRRACRVGKRARCAARSITCGPSDRHWA